MKTVEKHILPNGLRVVLAPRPAALATSVLVLVEAGSNYEPKEINGLSHFLEHLCFKGTTKRPQPLDIATALDALGASYNAFTSDEFTGYYATVAPGKTLAALELVADLYLNPTLPPAEIEKEKGVIVEEINMYEDMLRQKVQDVLIKLLYGDQAAGRTTLGTKESVRALSREQILDYRMRHYVASATVVAVAGNFSPAVVLSEIKKYFGGLAPGAKPGRPAVQVSQQAPGILVQTKPSDQTHWVIGLHGKTLTDSNRPALDLLAATLGGGMSSRLWRRVREELGAAYYVGASHDPSTDHGVFQIYAGVDTARAAEVMRVALEEGARMSAETVPEAELRRVKDATIGRMYLGLEKASALGQFYGFQELLEGRLRDPEEYAALLERVTSSDLQRLGAEIFRDHNLNLAIIGPFADEKLFIDILHLKR